MNEKVSCEKLFEIFHQIGGRLYCSRDEKRCVSITPKIKMYECNIEAKNKHEMDMKLWSFALEFDKYPTETNKTNKTNIATMEKICYDSGKWLKGFSAEFVINYPNDQKK